MTTRRSFLSFRALLLIAALFASTVAVVQDSAAGGTGPVLGGQLYSSGQPVDIEVLPATASLTSTLYLLEPEEVRIATNRDVGTVVTVGPYATGLELVFGIRVGGQEYRMGPAERNPDGVIHAQVEFLDDGCAIVGFEDLFGGGDRDYDDNVFRFCGGIASEPPDPDPDPDPSPFGPPVADAGPDESVPEGNVVTLDATGSTGGAGTSLGTSEAHDSLPGGTSIGATIAGLDPDAPGLVARGSVEVGAGPPVAATSLVYVIDVSGSANDPGGCGGDQNNDGLSNRIIDCQIAAALELHQRVLASGTVEKVGVVSFSSGASALDLDPTPAVRTLIEPAADVDGDGVLDIEWALRRLRASGSTNFSAAASTACGLLATTGSPNLISAFLSDGQANAGTALANVVPCNPPVVFHGFAFGTGNTCLSGPSGRRLQDLANLSGGTCTTVPNIADLPDILPGVISSRLVSATYTIDGGDPIELGEQLALPVDGPATLDVTFELPAGLADGPHEICLAVHGTDAGGAGSVTTCSDLVTVAGELTYAWTLLETEGPPIFLSSPSSATPSFVAPDDGRYRFEVTVSDATGRSDTDRVTVTVDNEDPALTIEPGEAYAGGVTLVNASLTDPGWLDTHAASIDWGDGTVDDVDVTAQGSGWGTFFGSHVYERSGTYEVTVTLTDDDGGTDVARVTELVVADPVAVWANSASAPRGLDWSGSSGVIEGRVHTNGELRFVGQSKSVIGPSTYAGKLSADTNRHIFTPSPATAPVQDFPIRFDVSDYRPGGVAAQLVGGAYNDMSSRCVDGVWHETQQVLPPGVYYADCAIQLNGSDIGGAVTLASEQWIRLTGSRPAFEPYLDGLLAVSGQPAGSRAAIDVSASSSKFLGALFSEHGSIVVNGSSNRFYCGILADTVSLVGGDLTLRGASCGRPDSTVSGPLLVPDLQLALEADRKEVVPSESVGYQLTATNAGALLVMPGLMGFENVDTTTATVTDHTFVVETYSVVDDAWVPFADAGDGTVDLSLRANPFAGVTYGPDGRPAGTTVEPGSWATWGYQGLLSLSAAQVDALLDPEVTGGIRARVEFDLAPSGVQARRLFTFGTDFIEVLRDLSGDVRDPQATLLLPEGDHVVFDGSSTPTLSSLAPGETVALPAAFSVPVPSPRGPTETDAGYLTRILARDGALLTASAFALADGGVGRLAAPHTVVSSTERRPVVSVSTVGPSTIPAGTSADYDLRLANLGSEVAESVGVTAAAGTTPLSVSDAPDTLVAGELATATTTYTAPSDTAGGPLPVRGETTWRDRAGNVYGAVGSTVGASLLAPATLSATLVDALHEDVAGDGVVSPGDTVRYTLTVSNGGGVPLQGVSVSVSPDSNGPLLAGSVTAPGGTVATGNGTGDDSVVVTFPTVAGGGSATVTFDARVADPFPVGVTRLVVQGSVTADGFEAVATDDPRLPGPTDPTRTTVVVPRPALVAFLTGQLKIDADGSGNVTAGDTLAYELTVNSVGTQQVTGVALAVPAPPGTTVRAGSVTTTQGTVTPGAGVDVAIGTLAPFQEARARFDLVIDDPLPAGVTQISVQGTVSSNELDPIVTDDPTSVGVGDRTIIDIGGSGSDPELPAPRIDDLSLAEGTVITDRTQLTATLVAPDGDEVAGWTLSYRRMGDSTSTQIAAGSGSEVDAVIDPTIMPNGSYVISLRATADGGGAAVTETSIVVDGQLKLGRFVTTYVDLDVGVAGLPIQVRRTYDSFNRASGDFGVGWTLDVADFQVATNGPLGAGGWIMEGCGSGLIFVPLCFRSTSPHYVTVTWPDGETEIFDLTPAQGSTFITGLTTAQFTGRPGSTSKLVAVDSTLYYSNGNLLGGFFGSGGVYDPKQFRLTDRYGTEYLLDVGAGLRQMRDLAGNTVTIDRNGITSSFGPSVRFVRDAAGRITQVDGPGTLDLAYAYDAAGDLQTVTDPNGETTTYHYDDHRLTGVDGPDGGRLVTLTYDGGRLTSVTDGEGNTTTVDIDVDARTDTVVAPDGRLTTVTTFDTRGNTIRIDDIFDGEVLTHRYEFDGLDRRTRTIDPAGAESTATYGANGEILTHVDPDGVRTDITYTSLAQPRTIRVDGKLQETYEYDAQGNTTKVIYADGSSVTYTYDSRGRPSTSTDSAGRTTSFGYDGSGFLSLIANPVGTTTFVNDAAGRTLSATAPGGVRTTYEYDAVGNVLSVRDGLDQHLRFEYDELHRLVKLTDGAGAGRTLAYDDASRVVRYVDREGVETSYVYDANGQVRERTTAGRSTTFAYDGLGRNIQATNDTAEVRFAWDAASNLVSETVVPRDGSATPPVTLTYDHTPGGRRAGITDSLGTTSIAYGDGGIPAGVTDSVAGAFTFHLDDLERLIALERPNGVRTEATYDADRLTSFSSKVGSTEVHRYELEYDARGYPNVVRDDDGVHTFTYDSAGRVTGADRPAGHGYVDETFTYDAAGNRTSWPGTAPGQAVYDDANRLLQDGTATYVYDDEGRLVRRTSTANGVVTSYTWDGAGQLARVSDSTGLDVAYGYDPLGRRVSETVGGEQRWTTYDGLNPRLEWGADGSAAARHVHGTELGSILASSDGTSSGVTYPLLDASGSVVGTTGATGQVLERGRYSTFGQPVGSRVSGPHGWHGMTPSSTGLDLTWARAYDPGTARFLSEDPILATNAYTYSLNNPLVLKDPTGLAAAVEYSATTQNSAKSAPAICTQGTLWGTVFAELATDIIFTTALSTVAPGGPGLYGFIDQTRGNKLYVGRSIPLRDRILTHLRAGRPKPGTTAFIIRLKAEIVPHIDVAEQLLMNTCGGKGALANRINAVNAKRQQQLGDLAGFLTGLLR